MKESAIDAIPFTIMVIYICVVFAICNSLLQFDDQNKVGLFEKILLRFTDSLGSYSVPEKSEDDEYKENVIRYS